MRLRSFINEVSDKERFQVAEFIKSIEKECKPYLKLLKGRSPMIRGMKNTDDMGVKPVRKDRTSKIGNSKETVKDINDYMDYIKAARRDRSVIAISEFTSRMSQMFGQPYWIFPIGGFKYTYIEAADFNYGSNNFNSTSFLGYVKDRRWEDYDMDDYGWDREGIVVNRDFDEAYNKGYETWFECDRYYYISLRAPFAAVFGNQMKYMAPSWMMM